MSGARRADVELFLGWWSVARCASLRLSPASSRSSRLRISDPGTVSSGATCVRNCSSGRNVAGSSSASAKIRPPISRLWKLNCSREVCHSAFFLSNESPIYFVSATNFNLLGLDEWVKGLRFISYIDCFDGQHPNVFVPSKLPHEVFQSIEEITNYLLEHKEVADYISRRSPGGKVLFLMFDEQTEELAHELNLEVCFPLATLRHRLDSKVVTTQIASEAGVASVPNMLTKVESYETLRQLSTELGPDLVIQLPFGDSGHTTFFISHEDDWRRHAEEIVKEPVVKVMKCIRCREAAIEACVTRHGTIVTPLMTELVGFPELTPYTGGWCGNEIFANAFTRSNSPESPEDGTCDRRAIEARGLSRVF